MEIKNKKLLQPYKLNDRVLLKNRLLFSNGQHELVQGPENYPADALFAEINDICSGGPALISFNTCNKNGGGWFARRELGEDMMKAHLPIFDYENPATQNYLCKLSQIVHMSGTKLLARMSPAFPDGCTYGGGDARSLFPVPDDAEVSLMKATHLQKIRYTMEEMRARIATKEMLKDAIEDITAQLMRFKSWGWDGLNFRADRYLDASTNLRNDEYNGEIEARGRFLYELFKTVKEKCGEDFIIEVVMPGEQRHGHDGELPHGYTLDECIRFLKMVEPVIDIIQLRDESGALYHVTGYNHARYEHDKVLEYCRAVKDAGIKCAVSANGGFQEPEDMESALESGACDLVTGCRAFIADPMFLRKIFTRGKEMPVPCIMCNKCHTFNKAPWIPVCSVNPEVCMHDRLPYMVKPVLIRKKVAVIGGGPIGMRTACYAAERGHDVVLYEKTDYLGGKLKYGDVYPFKWPIQRYRLWLIDEMKRRGVKVVMNHKPEREELTGENFDAVIACTGSCEARPPVKGADLSGVFTGEDVYEGRAVIGENVVVIGGGEVAVETAMYLCGIGKKVTIISRSGTLVKDDTIPTGIHRQFTKVLPGLDYGGMAPAWSIYDNLTQILNAVTTEISENSVTYVKEGETYTVACDSVVVNGGYRHNLDDALEYVGCAQEFYMAGDVEEGVSNLQQGNMSALGRALLL